MPANPATSVAGSFTANNHSYIATGDEEDVAVLTLDDRGMVCDCNPAGEALFKFRRSELVWRHVSMLLPQLAGIELVKNGQPNPHLRFVSRVGGYFQVVARDNECFFSELIFNLLDCSGPCRLLLAVRPIEVSVS